MNRFPTLNNPTELFKLVCMCDDFQTSKLHKAKPEAITVHYFVPKLASRCKPSVLKFRKQTYLGYTATRKTLCALHLWLKIFCKNVIYIYIFFLLVS